MKWYKDFNSRQIRFTDERQEHIETEHPEMSDQIDKIKRTLLKPDIVVKSRTDPEVELFFKHYDSTPVTKKYMCVTVKVKKNDLFIITAYFTDTIKRGDILWKKK